MRLVAPTYIGLSVGNNETAGIATYTVIHGEQSNKRKGNKMTYKTVSKINLSIWFVTVEENGYIIWPKGKKVQACFCETLPTWIIAK